MIKFKKFSFSILYIICSLLIFTFIMTIFSYFNIISDSTIPIFKIIIIIISSFIGSIYLGLNSNKGGYKNGFVLGLIYSCLLILLDLLFFDFKIKYLLFYIIIIVSCMLGSIIGIQKNKKD